MRRYHAKGYKTTNIRNWDIIWIFCFPNPNRMENSVLSKKYMSLCYIWSNFRVLCREKHVLYWAWSREIQVLPANKQARFDPFFDASQRLLLFTMKLGFLSYFSRWLCAHNLDEKVCALYYGSLIIIIVWNGWGRFCDSSRRQLWVKKMKKSCSCERP